MEQILRIFVMPVLTSQNELGNHPRLAQRGHTSCGGQRKMVLMAVCAAERSRCAWETMSVWNSKNDGPTYIIFSLIKEHGRL